MRSALKDAAKQAVRDERDAHQWQVSDYVLGRVVEVAWAIATGAPVPAEPAALEVESWETA